MTPHQQPDLLPDHHDRLLITEGVQQSVFISAGAGAGKTSALVGRIVTLVQHHDTDLGAIVAITFTEKAAAELRHRLRDTLERRGLSTAGLDEAPIGTLHAFARRLLAEFPTEVGLPPRFTVLDEVRSSIAFDLRFDEFARRILDDTSIDRLVTLCSIDQWRLPRDLRRLALDFQSNWDLVDERVTADLPPAVDPPVDDLATEAQRLAAFAVQDSSAKRAAQLLVAADQLASPELDDRLAALATLSNCAWSGCGSKKVWDPAHGPGALDRWRDEGRALTALAAERLRILRAERRQWIGALLRLFTLQSAEERRHDGELEFHDLLVLARRLLRDHPEVRRQLHQRFRAVFLDEFQDTDPIQLELALRLCADPDHHPTDWRDLQPLPGRLCVVGDPKQSIYRFRRADIAAYLAAESTLDVTPASLTSNFRSSGAVIDWVNHTLGNLIVCTPDVQPGYVALTAQRPAGRTVGSVTVLGAEAVEDRLPADELRAREASDVAAVVARAVADAWPVVEQLDDGTWAQRPCRLGDICILLPARTSLPALEAALTARRIPYRAENSSLVYAADDIRALMLALRAVDDPTDELAIVSTLRTSLFGCSDLHLAEWRVAHRQRFSWSSLPVDDDLADHPVRAALAELGSLHRMARTATPAQLLAHLVEARMVLELAVTQPDTRDVWRRVRFVIDQARAWSDAGGHGLRHYLQWVRLQGEDGRFVAETVLPETDHDAVRIMTVHAAKGLEFPVTVVSGLTTQTRTSRGKSIVWPGDGWTIADTNDDLYQDFLPVDEQMSAAERIRLWYVACTRARDHLVVSLHRRASGPRTAAAELAGASEGAAHQVFDGREAELPPPTAEFALDEPDDESRWAAARRDLLGIAGRTQVISATSLAHQFLDPGTDKDPVDLDLPPWRRGRYGTQVGRAVHAVLQHADLVDGHDIEVLASAQAAAEGVFGMEARIAALARSALQAPVVRQAVEHQHWRELFVATRLGDTVVEGYIDLLVRDEHGRLVVVDYKTDQIDDDHGAPARLEQYSVQLAAYALALEALLGEAVAAGVLVMCRADGPAIEVPIPDWDALRASLSARLVGGAMSAPAGT